MSDRALLSGFMSRGGAGLEPVAFRRGEPQSFRDLESRARCWRTAFEAAPGRRYALHSTDGLEFIAMLFGAWHAGKCALVPSDLQAGALAQIGVAIDGYAGMEGGVEAGAPSDKPWQMLDAELPLVGIFTSGSTGHPVCIAKCLRQFDAELGALAATLDLGPRRARAVGTVSHQHMYGIVFRLLLPLVTGRPFEALRLMQVHDLARASGPEGCVLVSSPAQLERLPTGVQAGGRVMALLSAGGSLDETAAQACRQAFGMAPLEIYGSSETGAVAWRRRAAEASARWLAFPGVEFRTEGELLQVRGRQLPTPEWFRSADRVVSGADGWQLVGRSDRIVKLEEKRVSLDAVERALLGLGLLRRVRALVLDGSRPSLAVVATPNEAGWQLAQQGKPQLVARLVAGLRGSAEVEVLPRNWRFVDPWPLTADGKSPESLLRKRFDRRTPEFRLLEQDAGSCVVELWVSPTSPFFNGHFPAQPILPGVAQIEWLVWLARELLAVRGGFAGLDAAKFRRAILPGSRLRVGMANNAACDSTSYEIACRGEICASGRIRWSDA